MENLWHSEPLDKILKDLDTSTQGLSLEESTNRLNKYGPNSLPVKEPPSLARLFLNQFNSPLIYILLISAAIVFFLGETIDSIVIGLVLLINAIIGTFQEGKAQNSLAALKDFVSTKASVIRGGKEIIIPDHDLVIGDIIMLNEGDKVPADARIISAETLKVEEAALTGESESVLKHSEPIEKEKVTPADQKNMIFKGTFIVSGNARAVVVSTGKETLIGKISLELASLDADMPLKTEIARLSNIVIIAVLVISIFLFFVGISNGISMREMFTVVIAVAVSAIPEGLPVVVTLILAKGVYRMGKQNALVKRLQAVEALGQADVIAVDKTGTITLNQMMVSEIYTKDTLYHVTGNGYEPKGQVMYGSDVTEHLNHPELILTGKIASLASSARFAFSEEKNVWQRVSGDPTEVALLVFSEKIGFTREALLNDAPKILEIPFDSQIKYHATVNIINDVPTLFVVGAPEIILERSTHIWSEKGKEDITKTKREELHKTIEEMSSRGLRVVAMAMKEHAPKAVNPLDLPELTFVAFTGIADVVREEALESIEMARKAGVKVVMITGDYSTTAKAIAKQVGIYQKGDVVITGKELETMSEKELAVQIKTASVFARVTPEHKLAIIRAYKNAGIVIAMTGDGVNDALSLSAADLGVAMGKIGTEVAKEASDIVLLDDNLGSIVYAIEEGRNIYKTIKKIIVYLFSTNIGEVLTITGAIMLGFAVPLSASQIIWLNFVTDGFLVVALATEPKEKNLLLSKPPKSEKRMITSKMFVRMALMGVTMMIGTLFVFNLYPEAEFAKASTMTLTILAVFQWMNALNCRSDKKSIFTQNPFENKSLVFSFIAIIILQMSVIYIPSLQSIMETVSLNASEWLTILYVALSIIAVEEIRKLFMRWRSKTP